MRGEVEGNRQGSRLGLPEPKRRTGQPRPAAGLGHKLVQINDPVAAVCDRRTAILGHKAGQNNAHYFAPGSGPKRKDHMTQINRISEGKWAAPVLSLNPNLASLDQNQAESQKIKVNQSGSKWIKVNQSTFLSFNMSYATPSRFHPSSPFHHSQFTIHYSPYGSIGVSFPKLRATVVSRKGGICGGHLPSAASRNQRFIATKERKDRKEKTT